MFGRKYDIIGIDNRIYGGTTSMEKDISKCIQIYKKQFAEGPSMSLITRWNAGLLKVVSEYPSLM